MGLEPPLHDPHTSMPGIDTSLSCDSRPRNSKSRRRTQTCAFTYSRVFSLNKSIRTWRRTKTFVLLVFILVLLAYSLSLCLCLCMYLCHDENQAYDEHHCHFFQVSRTAALVHFPAYRIALRCMRSQGAASKMAATTPEMTNSRLGMPSFLKAK